MEYEWINRAGNKDLILFFNGWGMEDTVVEHLDAENYDVVMFYDYNNLETDFNFKLQEYKEINLVAWSMGVLTAAIVLKNVPLHSKTALNGTLKPIDLKYGINPKIYDLTIKKFNSESRKIFIQNMFEEPVPEKFMQGTRTSENLKNELIALKSYSADKEFKYDKIYISNNDKIIPSKSQINYWKTEANLSGGHYPFNSFSKWSELL